MLGFISWSSLYGIFSFTAGSIALMIAIYLAPHWRNKSAGLLMGLMVSVSIWAMGYGMEFVSPTLELKLWWFTAKRLGNVWMPVFLFGFVLVMTGKIQRIMRPISLIFCVLSMFLFVLFITNASHHLMMQSVWIDTAGKAPILLYKRGSAFFGLLIYNYSLIFVAILVLIQSLFSARGIVRKQLLAVVFGISIPLFSNLLYQFGFDLFHNVDLTPSALAVSGIIFAIAVLRYQMVGLIPIAYETVVNSMGDPVIALDLKDRILLMNKAAHRLSGLEKWIPAHHRLKDVFPKVFSQLQKNRIDPEKGSQDLYHIEIGSRYLHLKSFPLLKEHEKIMGTLILLKDETDRMTAESALKKNERVHKSMLEASPNPIVFYDEKGRVTYLNKAFTQVFGWHQDELIGNRLDFVPKEDQEATRQALQQTIDTPEGNHNFITRRLTKSGDLLDMSLNAVMYRAEDGRFVNMVVNFTDITRLKKNERELDRSQNFIKNIIDSMPSIIIGVDINGRVTHWNLEIERLTGINANQAEGASLKEVFPNLSGLMSDVGQSIESQQVIVKEKKVLPFNDINILADITIYPMLSGNLNGAVIRVDDISERVRIEEMMVQSEKMLSVGGLAAGMAHEINNPLAGMLQNTQVIWNRLSENLPANQKAATECGIDLEDIEKYMEKRKIFTLMESIKSSGRRAAAIVSNMLAFSRKSEGKKSTYYLHDLMEDTMELVKNDYNLKQRYDFRDIEIVREYQDKLPQIVCEKNEIQQVLLNLLKNGAEAMSMANVAIPRFIFRLFKTETEIVLEIEDNGPGMDLEIRKRIFEPFFTTKGVGVGTGLGLSVSYFIVCENHKGVLAVESEPGKGSCFILKLPLFQD